MGPRIPFKEVGWMWSETRPESRTSPETVAPSSGVVMVISGGVLSTFTSAEYEASMPYPSRTTNCTAYVPSVKMVVSSG